MALPKQVTDAGQRSDDAIKKAFAQTTEATPAANTEGSDGTGQPAPDAPKPVQQAPAPTQPVVDTPSHEPDWKARYLTLQGKYTAEVPRLSKALNEATEKAAELEKQLDTLKQQGAPKSTPDGVTDDDRNRFDPDVIDMTRRIADEAARKAMEPLRGTVEDVEQRKKQEIASIAQGAFFETLGRLVPNWREVNQDAAFHAYLADVDATGEQRQVSLVSYEKDRDAASAAAVFLDFLRTKPQQAPPQPRRPAQQNVVPDLAGSGAARVASEGGRRTMTRKEVKAHYQDIATGKYRHDPEGRKKLEREIDLATVVD